MAKKYRAYIAGPMSNLPEFNYPLFNQVAAEVESYGYDVYNPAYRTDTSLPWAQYMRENIAELTQCDVIVLLPGWGKSRGATLERAIAVALEMPVVNWPDGICRMSAGMTMYHEEKPHGK
jgi:hypothetical protein